MKVKGEKKPRDTKKTEGTNKLVYRSLFELQYFPRPTIELVFQCMDFLLIKLNNTQSLMLENRSTQETKQGFAGFSL